MIEEVRITGFKRFAEQRFALEPLTILAGVNGSGKTSFLHALLLAREAWRRGDGVVELNGPFNLALGSFEDVLNQNTTGSFQVRLKTLNGPCEWTFSEGETSLYASVAVSPSDGPWPFAASTRAMQYLSAERLGPRVTLSSAALPPDLLAVGSQGEFSAQVVDTLGKRAVDKRRASARSGEDDLLLLKVQTERWLSRVTRPVQIDTEGFGGTSVVALKFRTRDQWVKPTNMGFGITYALPVILAGLIADEGGLLIIENPEAHLHPGGQSEMGLFLATIAAAGVQVIVETHSDHVLNGIRRSIGVQQVLPAQNAIVQYFGQDGSDPLPLAFTDKGGVSDWPRGFFDQYQLDISSLTRVRRPR